MPDLTEEEQFKLAADFVHKGLSLAEVKKIIDIDNLSIDYQARLHGMDAMSKLKDGEKKVLSNPNDNTEHEFN